MCCCAFWELRKNSLTQKKDLSYALRQVFFVCEVNNYRRLAKNFELLQVGSFKRMALTLIRSRPCLLAIVPMAVLATMVTARTSGVLLKTVLLPRMQCDWYTAMKRACLITLSTMKFPSVASRTLSNPPINNRPTLHTTHFTLASALGGVAPPRGGETCDRSFDFALTGFAQDDTSQGSMSRACSASSTRPGPPSAGSGTRPGNAQGRA